MTNKISVIYNMLVRGQLGPHDEEEWLIAHTTADFEVLQGDDVRTPLAMTFRREPERYPSKYRYDHVTGRLFEKVATMRTMLETTNHNYDRKYPSVALNDAVYMRAKDMIAAGTPVNGAHRASTSVDLSSLYDVNPADVKAGQEAAEKCMADWLIAEGAMWKVIPEPIFHVYRTNDGWKTALVPYHEGSDVYGQLGRDRRHFHFGMGEYEELMTWKAHLSEVTHRPSTRDEFVAFDVYEPKVEGMPIDLKASVGDILARFEKACDLKHVQVRKPLDFISMPMPLLDLFHETRRLHEEAKTGWSDDLAGRIVAHLEGVAEFVAENPACKELFAKPSENAYHVERWHSRPISLMTDMSFAP